MKILGKSIYKEYINSFLVCNNAKHFNFVGIIKLFLPFLQVLILWIWKFYYYFCRKSSTQAQLAKLNGFTICILNITSGATQAIWYPLVEIVFIMTCTLYPLTLSFQILQSKLFRKSFRKMQNCINITPLTTYIKWTVALHSTV